MYSVGGVGDVTAPRGKHRPVAMPGPGRQGAVRSATMRQAFQADQEVKSLILSYLILSYLILSYLILSYLILSYLILSYLIFLILSYLILSYLILSYLILGFSPILLTIFCILT
jgi:hypothetical protein